jgi:hypothetical protein
MIEWLKSNFRTVAGIGLLYVGYVEFTGASYPSVPEGSGVAAVGAVAVAIAGYAASGKIQSLLPEEEGIYLVAFKSSEEAGGEIWEITEDQFTDMEVVAGTLFQWSGTPKRVYEVRDYRPEDNVAVANWRESVAASELAGDTQVVDAMEEIKELRAVFEPESQKFRLLKRRLRGVARKLDRRRAEDQQTILDANLTPGFDDEKQATVSDIINEELPEELRPESMGADEDEPGGGGVEDGGDFAGFELLDDEEDVLANGN